MSQARVVQPRESVPIREAALETDPLLSSTRHDELLEGDLLTPLAHQQQKKRGVILLRNYGIAAIIILACISLIVVLVMKTSMHLQDITSQCVAYDILSISLESIRPTYFDTQITGSLTIDPDLIQSPWYRAAVKSIMWAMGLVAVSSKPRMLIFTKTPDSSMPFVYVASLEIPDIAVNLTPRASNQFNLSVKTKPNPKNILELAKTVGLQKLTDGTLLDFCIYGDARLTSRHITYKTGGLKVETTQMISTKSYIHGHSLEHFSLLSSVDAIYVDGIVNIDSELPLSAHVVPIQWDLLMDDCQHEPIEFGSWGTDYISVRPMTPLAIMFSGSVTEIPSELSLECENGYSPFNMMMKNYTEHKPINLAVRASRGGPSSLPEWLKQVLHDFVVPVSILLPSLNFQPLKKSLDSASMAVADSGRDLLVRSLAQISGRLESILGIGRSYLNFTGEFSMRTAENETFLTGNSHSMNLLSLGTETSNDQFVLNLSNWDITILNPHIVAMILNNHFNGQISNSTYYADLFLPDLSVKSGFFDIRAHDIIIRDLAVTGRSILHVIDSSRTWSDDESLISHKFFSLRNLNMSVYDVTYKSSTLKSIDMVCNIEMFNPTEYALDIFDQDLITQFAVDDYQIGQATVANLSIPANNSFRQSVDLVLMADSKEGKIKLERWLGQFVSTSVPSSIDKITFNTLGNLPIQNLLNLVSLGNVSMPQIEFQHVRNYVLSNKTETPFVLRSIIHVLTSEIELTLFNPISNLEAMVTVLRALAKFNDILLGNLDHSEVIEVPPGIHQSHRLAFSIERGIGMDVLRRALNGDIPVDISATIRLTLGDFAVNLEVGGVGITCDIRV